MTVHYKGIVPYLFYDDAEAAIDWYTRVFGFVEINRWCDKDGKIHNAEMRVGDTELWIDGGGRHLLRREDNKPVWIGVWVDDVDAMYEQVKAAGVSVDPPVDRNFGVRILTVADPAGYQWGFMCRK
jgi:uncharacterized glyoxalase superfamily protein PhnB